MDCLDSFPSRRGILLNKKACPFGQAFLYQTHKSIIFIGILLSFYFSFSSLNDRFSLLEFQFSSHHL